MAGKIPQSFIDDLLDRTDIVDVIGGRVDLRKAGKNHKARCPFHDEKTPSFSVNQDKQFYYCFGCQAGGNAIGFIMDYDRIDFPEAVERLAHQAGLEVPREAGNRDVAASRRNPLYDILSQADSYYREQLRTHPAGNTAVDYLKLRGLSGEVARDFGIGLAPPGWDNLITALAHNDRDLDLLLEAGLVIEREDGSGHYDRFRHRIVFPIRDTRGRTIGFGGRVLGDEQPKYLNSPETPVFHKGRELYGLYEARSRKEDLSSLLVVEGYMDVVALAQFGIHNVVATLGTAITDQHLQKLYRYCDDVVFCFDGDNAGRKAARRALETALPAFKDGYSARFLFLPDGEDPDTLVRHIGSEKFQRLITEAMPLSEFLFTNCSENLNLDTPDDRAKLSQRAAPFINSAPEGVFRQLLLSDLAEKTGLDKDILATLVAPTPTPEDKPASPHHLAEDPSTLNSSMQNPALWGQPIPDNQADAPPLSAYSNDPGEHHTYPTDTTSETTKPGRYTMPPVHRLLALLLTEPALCCELDDDLQSLHTVLYCDDAEPNNEDSNPDIDMLFKLRELIASNPDYTLNHILGYWRGVNGQGGGELLARIAATDWLITPSNTPRHNLTEAQDIITRLMSQIHRQQPADQRLRQLLDQHARDHQESDQQSPIDTGLDKEHRSRLSGLILELAQHNPEHPLIKEAKQKLAKTSNIKTP